MNIDTEEKFAKAQQEQIAIFKVKMKSACEDVLSTMYCDIFSEYGVTDAHVNFKNALWDEVIEDFKKEIVSEYGHYSRAHSLRMELLKNHKEDLQNKIIQDLQEKISSLERNIEQLLSRRF
jgi:enamine deaminase RidA (YjgF/YER057c/UK114 family)